MDMKNSHAAKSLTLSSDDNEPNGHGKHKQDYPLRGRTVSRTRNRERAHRGVRISAWRGVRISGRSGVRISGNEGVRISGHRGVRISGQATEPRHERGEAHDAHHHRPARARSLTPRDRATPPRRKADHVATGGRHR
ncbi:hypothetical protein SAMN04489718_2126 [Actinopolyspora saharensis]|uniref:Uncharacterized protein n=1 Tax=Actinopolyspora saharensis TaxID=995062 RepID=A0A1H1DLN2_9ACTN|nr:hypothetical protein SAMN04489718_2126 [Actinopolyspora saharensis]